MVLIRSLFSAAGFALVFAATAGTAGAVDTGSVPELNPGSVASALTLLTAGVLMLTAGRRRKG
jgi:hypothetical protein